MKTIDLLNSVVDFNIDAVNDYLAMSSYTSCAWDMPEYWLRGEVARLLRQRHRLNVWLELGVEKLFLEFFERSTVPSTIRIGKLDLALFDPAAAAPKHGFCGIVELKRFLLVTCTQSNGCDIWQDTKRIREINRKLRPISGVVAGMFVGDADTITDAFASRLGIDRADVVCRSAPKPDSRGYRYGALGAIVSGL